MRAIIIGGGIAGASTAIALHSAGIDCEIHEARGENSGGVGAFLTLAVNGIAALRMLGVDITRWPGIDTPTMHLGLGDGRQLTSFPLGPTLPDGTVTRTIKRAVLHAALHTRLAELGIPVTFGRRLVEARTVETRVSALFDDGSAITGDLLIGADGLHSRVRSIIDARAPRPHYLGILNAGGYANAHGIDVGESETMHMTFGTRTFFSWVGAPDGEVWWFANPPAAEPERGELAAIPGERWRQMLLDLVAEDSTPAAQLIEASSELFTPWPTHDLRSVPHWHRDRMIIVGDAAHAASPSSGQGASMAIEDALVLAISLRDSSSIDAAFTRYEKLRRRRVTRVVTQGRRNGTGKTPGPFGRKVRDRMLRLVFASPPRTLNADSWLYGYEIDWASGVVGTDG